MNLTTLKQSLQSKKLPVSIQLKDGEFVSNVALFVTNHIAVLEANKGNKRFLPYWDRLVLLLDKIG